MHITHITHITDNYFIIMLSVWIWYNLLIYDRNIIYKLNLQLQHCTSLSKLQFFFSMIKFDVCNMSFFCVDSVIFFWLLFEDCLNIVWWMMVLWIVWLCLFGGWLDEWLGDTVCDGFVFVGVSDWWKMDGGMCYVEGIVCQWKWNCLVEFCLIEEVFVDGNSLSKQWWIAAVWQIV